MEKINNSELISVVAIATGFSKAKVKEILDATELYIFGAVKQNQEIQLGTLGKFYPLHREERDCINPLTGKKIVAKARTAIRFKPSAKSRDI